MGRVRQPSRARPMSTSSPFGTDPSRGFLAGRSSWGWACSRSARPSRRKQHRTVAVGAAREVVLMSYARARNVFGDDFFRSCDPGYTWDYMQGGCVPLTPSPSGDCPEGMTYSSEEKGCVLVSRCPKGSTWDSSKKRCAPSEAAPPGEDCPEGMTYSQNEDACVLAHYLEHGCGGGSVWSPSEGVCVGTDKQTSSSTSSSSKTSGSISGGSASGSRGKASPSPPEVNKQSIWNGPAPWILGGAVLIGMGMLAFSTPETRKATPNRRRKRRA